MNFEKLGMMLLSHYLSPFESVKDHLARALGECLKAGEETLKIVQRGGEGLSLHPAQSAILSKVLSPLELFLRQSGERLVPDLSQNGQAQAPSDTAKLDPAIHQLKSHILQSLIESLDAEIDRTRDAELPGSALKIEALETVKRSLAGHTPTKAETPRHTPESPTESDGAEALILIHTQSMSGEWEAHDAPDDLSTLLQVESDHSHDATDDADAPLSRPSQAQVLHFRAAKTA